MKNHAATHATSRALGALVATLMAAATAMTALANDYVLSTPLPQSSWTEMGPCPSIECIHFPIEARATSTATPAWTTDAALTSAATKCPTSRSARS